MTSTNPTNTSARLTRPNSSGPRTRARTTVATSTRTLPRAKDSPCHATALTVAPVSFPGPPGAVATPAPPVTSGSAPDSCDPRPERTPGSCCPPVGLVQRRSGSAGSPGRRTRPPSGIIRPPGGASGGSRGGDRRCGAAFGAAAGTGCGDVRGRRGARRHGRRGRSLGSPGGDPGGRRRRVRRPLRAGHGAAARPGPVDVLRVGRRRVGAAGPGAGRGGRGLPRLPVPADRLAAGAHAVAGLAARAAVPDLGLGQRLLGGVDQRLGGEPGRARPRGRVLP